MEDVNKKLGDLENKRVEMLKKYGSGQKLVKQLIDLALLANNQLKGEDLAPRIRPVVFLIPKVSDIVTRPK